MPLKSVGRVSCMALVTLVATVAVAFPTAFAAATTAAANSDTDVLRRFPAIQADHPAFPAPRKHHVAVLSIPFYGHFLPLKALAEALLRRGHDVTVFTEKAAWCETHLAGHKQLGCVVMAPSGAFPPELLQRVSDDDNLGNAFSEFARDMGVYQEQQLGPIIREFEALNASGRPISGILTDAATFPGYDIAAKFNIPLATCFPLVLSGVSSDHVVRVPPHGLDIPRPLSLLQKLGVYVLRAILIPIGMVMAAAKASEVRARHGIVPYRTVHELQGLYGPVFAPAIWGYDIPQPLCPNVFPLGTLVPAHPEVGLEDDVRAMLDGPSCAVSGTVYINFGTLSVLPERVLKVVLEAVAAPDFQPCILWKPNKEHVDVVNRALEGRIRDKRAIVKNFFLSPPAIMSHQNVRVFVTHCGDTSVGEAVEARLPMLGIPMFADQVDVCNRITEAGAGRYLGHKSVVTAPHVRSAIAESCANETVRTSRAAAFDRLLAMAQFLGGADRGAQIAEAEFNYRLVSRTMVCEHLDPVRLGTVDPVTGAVDTRIWRQLLAVVRSSGLDGTVLLGVLPCLFIFGILRRTVSWLVRRLFGKRRASSPQKSKRE